MLGVQYSVLCAMCSVLGVGCFGYCVLGVRCDVRCSMRDVLGVMFYVLRIRPYALCVMRSELAVRC